METLLNSYLLISVIVILVLLQVYFWWSRRRADKAMGKQADESFTLDVPAQVRELLKKLNCIYEEDEDVDDKKAFVARFTYQGEHFWLSSHKDRIWVRIVDCTWYSCPLENLEEMACMQKAINIANAATMLCAALYEIDNEERIMNVLSKCEFALPPQFQSDVDYFTAYLDSFFYLQRNVMTAFEKEKNKMAAM